jgi:hypothetical protein
MTSTFVETFYQVSAVVGSFVIIYGIGSVATYIYGILTMYDDLIWKCEYCEKSVDDIRMCLECHKKYVYIND